MIPSMPERPYAASWSRVMVPDDRRQQRMRVLMQSAATLMQFMEPAASDAADMARGLSALERGDYGAALADLRPLAERGDAWAEYEVGMMFCMGLGVPRDFEQASAWLKQSAARGNACARDDLAALYDRGR